MTTTKYPLGFAGFVDSATGSIIEVDLLGNRQAPTQTQERADFKIVELTVGGRQAPIQTQQRADFKLIDLTTLGRQQAIIEAQKKLEAAIVELNVING